MGDILTLDFQLLRTSVAPKEITARTGITPDFQLLKGERDMQKILPRHNIWSIGSKIDSDDLEEHWSVLRGKLDASREVIRDIRKTGVPRLTIMIGSRQRIPSIKIPPSMSEFAGYVNAEIDIDHLQP
jgi:hypothetical protein